MALDPGDHELGGGEVVAQSSAQLGEHVADDFEADAGVEQLLDDLELEQVAVRVHPPGAAPLRIGHRRTHQIGARPVVELPVRDAHDLSRAGATPTFCWNYFHETSPRRMTPSELHRCKSPNSRRLRADRQRSVRDEGKWA